MSYYIYFILMQSVEKEFPMNSIYFSQDMYQINRLLLYIDFI